MARPNVSVYIDDQSFVIPNSLFGTTRGGMVSNQGLVDYLGTTAERKSGVMEVSSVGNWVNRLTVTDPIGGSDNPDGVNHVGNSGVHATAGTTGAARWPLGPTGSWRGEWWCVHNFLQYGGVAVIGGTGSEQHTTSGKETLKDTSIPLDVVFAGAVIDGAVASNDYFNANTTNINEVDEVVLARLDCVGVVPHSAAGHTAAPANPVGAIPCNPSEHLVCVWGDKKHLGIQRTSEILNQSSLLTTHLAPDVAGCMVRTDANADPWISPAGFKRGDIMDVIRLAHNPTEQEQDRLYDAKINPVVTFPAEGTVLWGDKTCAVETSTLSRINVSRLFVYLKKVIGSAARNYLFEMNDSQSRNSFVNAVEPLLTRIKNRRGIYDFKVICDETNNPGAVVDANQFVADVLIKPAKSINFVRITFTNKNTADVI
ncbi:hypothetical protein CL614_07525 [archaeon]|nr:hypothetical protein [archaeon]|tara:strand:- start:4 stop:1284 length:1281 start_codon:yes stop_codon:yes gene_type:complete